MSDEAQEGSAPEFLSWQQEHRASLSARVESVMMTRTEWDRLMGDIAALKRRGQGPDVTRWAATADGLAGGCPGCCPAPR
jgi:hypothetical protein